MKVSGMLGAAPDMTPQAIAELEKHGYDTVLSAEVNNDPFFPLILGAEHSENCVRSAPAGSPAQS